MRKRLSWDEDKIAEITKMADPYTMNQDHKNNPVEKYRSGDPSSWAEDPNTQTPWKNEGRTETGHPAPAARQAVVNAKKLEDKAIKCITIAQRMLPGATDDQIESQATDLMYLPERSVMATLQRQSEVAMRIAAEKEEEEKEPEEPKEAKKEPEEEEEVVEAKEDSEEEPEEPKEAKKAPKIPKEEEVIEAKEDSEEEPEEPKEAKKAPKIPKDEEVVEAKKGPKIPKEEEVIEARKEKVLEDLQEEKSASEKDLLDVIFDTADIAPEPKIGAKKLSGLVKKATTGEDPLANLWDAPPDVSKAFK